MTLPYWFLIPYWILIALFFTGLFLFVRGVLRSRRLYEIQAKLSKILKIHTK